MKTITTVEGDIIYQVSGYEDIEQLLETIPVTYLPALLVKTIEVCYERKVLQKGAASMVAKRVENRLNKR
jgi:hypothetical protein